MKITLKFHFLSKNVTVLSLCTQRCYGRHNVSRKSVTTSGLPILLHGVIFTSRRVSCDEGIFIFVQVAIRYRIYDHFYPRVQ